MRSMTVGLFEIQCVADDARYVVDANNNRRLDKEIVVLQGSEEDAGSQILRGVVVLRLTAPLNVESVYLQMIGKCRIR